MLTLSKRLIVLRAHGWQTINLGASLLLGGFSVHVQAHSIDCATHKDVSSLALILCQPQAYRGPAEMFAPSMFFTPKAFLYLTLHIHGGRSVSTMPLFRGSRSGITTGRSGLWNNDETVGHTLCQRDLGTVCRTSGSKAPGTLPLCWSPALPASAPTPLAIFAQQTLMRKALNLHDSGKDPQAHDVCHATHPAIFSFPDRPHHR